MSDNAQENVLLVENLLATLAKQLKKMEHAEQRRLGWLTGQHPERAFEMGVECEGIFTEAVELKNRLDGLMSEFDLKDASPRHQKRIGALQEMVRNLSVRNAELNKNTQQIMKGLMGEVSGRLNTVQKGRKALKSYAASTPRVKTLIQKEL